MAVLIVLPLLGWLLPGEGRRRFPAESMMLTSSGLLLVVGATMTTMFDYRYLLPALPLIGTGGALGASSCVRWLRARLAVARPDAPPFRSGREVEAVRPHGDALPDPGVLP